MLDALAALRLQLDWGADEAVGAAARNRFADAPVAGAPPLAAPPLAAPVAGAPLPAAPAGPALPAATTIAELMAELQSLPGIGLRDTATHFVPVAGDPAADIVLIAEAPSADDDRTGAAFSGPNGMLLDRVFSSISLPRARMLLTYLVPWRPPGGRPPNEREINLCLPYTRKLLTLSSPRLAILVGATVLRTLTGEPTSARRARSRMHQVSLNSEQIMLPAVALPGLDQWLKTPSAKQRLWADLIFLQRALATV